ncbi:MAG: hypothetical protein A2089_00865 [Elusimicrobia bacterium GWD2_63_28]|nr:MAG: hypothetical protein A2089_00865 [Elusimicrobia bacterium GWD2_63_28]
MFASAGLLLSLSTSVMAVEIGITVVTPARTMRSIGDAPGSVEVITKEQLETAHGAALNDKLAGLVPGAVTSRAYGIYSHTSALTLRGLPSGEQARTLILLDGAPVNTSATGSVNWNRLALESIDRVEIVKGPASSLYGSNAAAGVVNIVTRKTPSGCRLGASYGTYNTFRTNAGAGAKIKDISLSADGNYLSSDGYNSTPAALRTAYSVKNYLREKSAAAKGSLDLKEAGVLDAEYSRTEGLRGEGYRIRANAGSHRRYTTDSARAAWSGARGGLAWQAQAYYQLEDYERLGESTKSGYTRVDTAALREDTGGQAAVSLAPGGFTLTLGADYKLGSVDATDHYTAPTVYDAKNRGRSSQYAPYAQAEKKLAGDRLKFLAALRYDNASYFGGYFNNPSNAAYSLVNGPQSGHYWDNLSPKLAVSWEYSDLAEQYLSYGRGFRPPSLEDMCLTLKKGAILAIANPGLKPETVDTAETGFKLHPAAGLYLEPAAYYTVGRRFMYSASLSATESQIRNVGEVRIYGAELPLKYYSGAFSASAAYAWSESEIEEYAAAAALEGKSLAYAPRHTASANIGLKTVLADITLAWLYKSRQYTQDNHSAWVRGYHNLSASVARALAKSVLVRLSVDNVFDKRYQEKSDELAPGRTVTAALEARF